MPTTLKRWHSVLSLVLIAVMLGSLVFPPQVLEAAEPQSMEQEATAEAEAMLPVPITTPELQQGDPAPQALECMVAAAIYIPFVRQIERAPGANRAPVARDCTTSLEGPLAGVLELSSLAQDPEGEALSFGLSGEPSNGSVALVGTTLWYTPTADFSGTVALSYSAADSGGLSDSGIVMIQVSNDNVPTNQAPVAQDLQLTVANTDTVSVDLANHASDPDGDSLSFSIVQQPNVGGAALEGSVLTYTPQPGFEGTTGLVYGVEDGRGGSAQASVAISVTAQANQAPVLNFEPVTLANTQTLSLDLTTLAEDPDGDPLDFSIVGLPSYGQTSLITTVLSYAPISAYVGEDQLEIEVQDGRGGSVSGTLVIDLTGTSDNQAPIVLDQTIKVLGSQGGSYEVERLAIDPNPEDSLSYTLVSTATELLASIEGEQLIYTPTQALTQAIALDYEAQDNDGAATRGTLIFEPARAQLYAMPGAVRLSGSGEERSFSVVLIDADGRELPVDGLDLEWRVDREDLVGLSANGGQATIESLANVGSAVISVRSLANPSIEPALIAVTIAQLQPDVTAIAENAVVFPIQNQRPNQAVAPFPAGPNGTVMIGPFNSNEVLRLYDVPGDITRGITPTTTRYPAVVVGIVPQVGELVLIGESTPTMGRVMQVWERDGHALLQLEWVNFPEIFAGLAITFSVEELIAEEFLRTSDIIEAQPSRGGASLTADSDDRFPGCLTNVQTSPRLLSLKFTELSMTPKAIGDFDIAVDDPDSLWPTRLKVIFGIGIEGAVKTSIGFQAGLEFGITCKIGNGIDFKLPNVGHLAMINLAIGPRIEVAPVLGMSLKFTGGPAMNLAFTQPFTAQQLYGFVWENNSGRLVDEFTKNVADVSMDSFSADGASIPELTALDIEFKAGVYLEAKAMFVLGGSAFDVADVILDSVASEWFITKMLERLKDSASFTVIGAKIGVELKIAISNFNRVFATKENQAKAVIQLAAEGTPGDLGTAIRVFKLPLPLEQKLFEWEQPILSLYEPLTAGNNQAIYPDDGENVRFDIKPIGPNRIFDEQTGLYKEDGEMLVRLDLQANGDFTALKRIDDSMCAAESQTYHAIVYNTMFGVIPIPNYVGPVQFICDGLTLEVALEPLLGANGFQQCVVPEEGAATRFPLTVHVRASDAYKKMERLTASVVGQTQEYEPLPGSQDATLDHIFAITPNDPGSFEVIVTLVARDENNAPTRTRERKIPVTITWFDCEKQVRLEARTREETCWTIIELQDIETIIYRDRITGQEVRREERRGPWRVGSAQSKGDCSRPRRTSGDPHIATPDGRRYDSFALGEFVYLQPQAGASGMTVHARQERVEIAGNVIMHPWTSWVTAIAIGADGHVIELRSSGDDIEELNHVIIDGEERVLEPGLHAFGDIDISVVGPRRIDISHNGYTISINHVLSFLELSYIIPQDNTHEGMLGVPNGVESDDWRLPDGTQAADAFALAEGWRITERAASLFTYDAGEGPETFNQPQIDQPPTPQELAPYTAQAQVLLENVCRSDTPDPIAINNIAIELFTGRQPAEIVSTGLCWYLVEGQVTNALVAGLPVPGAVVTISSAELDTCETVTDRDGRYRCYMPALGTIPTVTVSVSGRGSASESLSFDQLPPMQGFVEGALDLSVTPTTVRVDGMIRDSQSGLYSAQIYLTGPEAAGFGRDYGLSDATGAFTSYLMLDDGALGGDIRFDVLYSPDWSASPDAPALARGFVRTLSALEPNALNAVSTELVIEGGVVRFGGQISYMPGNQALKHAAITIVDTNSNQTLCSTETLSNGSYICDVPLMDTAAFSATIHVGDLLTSDPYAIDPSGIRAGELYNIAASFTVESRVLTLSGQVTGPTGPVSGAQVQLSGNTAFNLVETSTNVSGSYTAVLILPATSDSIDVTAVAEYGTAKSTTQANFSNIATQDQRSLDLSISGGRMIWKGRVTNLYAPAQQLSGSVAISDSQGLICQAQLSGGYYQCISDVPSSPAPIALTYALSGVWGTRIVHSQQTQLPVLGGELIVARDFRVQPTTLNLRGTVTNSSGQPLAGAAIRVAADSYVEGMTDNAGHYNLWLTVPVTSTDIVLGYTIRYRQATITGSRAETVAPNTINTITHDMVYSQRLLRMRGTITTPHGPIPNSQLQIRGAGISGMGCVTQPDSSGEYICLAQVETAAPFSATYTLSGDWGSQIITETIDPTVAGDLIDHVADIEIAPQVGYIEGMIFAPDTTPLANVSVMLQGATLVSPVTVKTDATGTYRAYFHLRSNALVGSTQRLTLRIGYGEAVTTRTHDFVVQAGITQLYKNIELTMRALRFSGTVSNGFNNNEGLLGTRVIVSSAEHGRLCEWASQERYTSSIYRCDAAIFTDQPFDVTYSLSGAWGSALITGTVTTLPPVGQLATISRGLTVYPTTVSLNGTIRDSRGQVLPGARVSITSPDFIEGVEVIADQNGSYTSAAVLKQNQTSTTAQYVVAMQSVGIERTVVISAALGARSSHQEDFALAVGQRLTLSGRLQNRTMPSHELNGMFMAINEANGSIFCQSEVRNGVYTCVTVAPVDTATTVNMRITGVWGNSTSLRQVIPAGTESFEANFAASPSMLTITGRVTNGTAPLPGVVVDGISYDAIPGRSTTMQAFTDQTGVYTLTSVLQGNVLSGQAILTARNGIHSASAQTSFTLPQGSSTVTVSQDLVINSRGFIFSGQLTNSLVTGIDPLLGATQLTLFSPEHGVLCTNSVRNSYRCSVQLDTDEPFTVEYRLNGDWGSLVKTQTISTIPQAGMNATITHDLSVTPTMLQVSGRVVSYEGEPIGGVAIRPLSSAVVAASNSLSGSDGTFTLLVTLGNGPGQHSGDLELSAMLGASTAQVSVPYTAIPSGIVAINAEDLALGFDLLPRTVNLQIKLANTLVPNEPSAQPLGQISVIASDGTPWCNPTHTKELRCAIRVYDNQPIAATITVNGEWGSVTRSIEISELPEPGRVLSYPMTISVAATALLLEGTVVNDEGTGLAGAFIYGQIASNGRLYQTPELRTDVSGRYRGYVLLPGNLSNPSLQLNISYDGIPQTIMISPLAIQPLQLNQRDDTIVFDKRRVRFSGTVTNELAASTQVPGIVSITSEDLAGQFYCDAVIRANNTYACDAYVRSSEPFTVNYRIRGGWGVSDFQGSVDGVPGTGGSVAVERDLSVRPTTLRFTGTITDPGTRPLPAQVQVSNGALGSPGAFMPTTTTADASGRYTVTVLLNADQIDGSARFVVRYGNATLEETHQFFGIERNALNTRPQSFVIGSRSLTLSGSVTHRDLPQMALSGYLYVSNINGQLCATSVSSTGTYSCEIDSVPTDAFTATYTLVSDWGTAISIAEIPLGPTGSETAFSHNFTGNPTVLSISGTARSDGSTVSGVSINLSSPDISLASPTGLMTTDTEGQYARNVIIKANRSTGNITFQLRYGTVAGAARMPFVVTTGQVTPMTFDLPFSIRTIAFGGIVRNRYNPAIIVPGAEVKVTSPLIGDLCTTIANAQGTFACSLQVMNLASFPIQYVVTGNWGRVLLGGTVPPGPVGGTTPVNADLAVDQTTLAINGTVLDQAGDPVNGALIYLSGANITAATTATTGLDGSYTAYAVLRSGLQLAQVDYEVRYNGRTLRTSNSYVVERNTLNPLTEDFSFALRTLVFTGSVTNTNLPSMSLGAQPITISSAPHGALCTAMIRADGTYACQTDLASATPFTATFVLSGTWGSATYTQALTTLPAVGETLTVTQDFAIAPTTLIATGVIRNSNGQPLPGATLRIATANVDPLTPSYIDATSLDGRYELPLIIGTQSLTGELSATASINGVAVATTLPYSITLGDTATITNDITITQRQVTFKGDLVNGTSAQANLLGTKVVVSDENGTQLCAWTSLTPAKSYTCTAYVSVTESFSATYTASGVWGEATASGIVPAGADGSQTTVSQAITGQPTMIHLTGQVVSTDNDGIGSASVIIESASFMGLPGGAKYRYTTNAEGFFQAWIILAKDTTSAQLAYEISSGVTKSEYRTITVNPGVLNPINHQFTLSERMVNFNGVVRNANGLNTPLGAISLNIASPANGVNCTYTPPLGATSFSSYGCSQAVAETDAFSVTYTLIGDWGTQIFTGSVPAGQSGVTTGVRLNLDATPTTLRLTGIVQDPLNRRLAGVKVSPAAGSVSQGSANVYDMTDLQGVYELYVALPANVTAGTLEYGLEYSINGGTIHGAGTAPYTAVANQSTDLIKNHVIDARGLRFSGLLRHAEATWKAVPVRNVTIHDLAGNRLCAWNADLTQQSSNYACAGQITETTAISITYTVSGLWGSQIFTDTVPPGDLANTISVAENLYVMPTTLRISGQARTRQGSPLVNQKVTISSPAFLDKLTVNTDGSGRYEELVYLKEDAYADTILFEMTYGASTQRITQAFSTTAYTTKNIAQDLVFDNRQVIFQGPIVLLDKPEVAIKANRVTVRDHNGTELCRYNPGYHAQEYICSATIGTTDAFTVTYAIEGDWGTAIASASIPAGTAGTTLNAVRTLPVRATVIHLHGWVTDGEGAPLAGALVGAAGESQSSGVITSTATTDATGLYDLYLVQKQRYTNGTLNLSQVYGSVNRTATVAWSGQPLAITPIVKTFQVTERLLRFTGTIRNPHAPSLTIPVAAFEVRSQEGLLCADDEAGSSYSCTATITATTPLSVTYVVSGTWGERTLPGQSVVDFPALGGRNDITAALPITLTTALISGTVEVSPGVPLANAYVDIEGPALVANVGSAWTNAQGRFTLTAMVKDGVTTDTFTYTVQNQAGVLQTLSRTLDLVPGELNELSTTLAFTGRRITFSGQVSSAFTGAALGFNRIRISSANHGELCAMPLTTGSYTTYSCQGVVADNAPFLPIYTVEGLWGSETITATTPVTPGAIGQTINATLPLVLRPATLTLKGTLSDPDGAPLPGARLSVYHPGAAGATSFNAYADATGAYTLPMTLRSTHLTGTLYPSLVYSDVTQYLPSRSYTATLGAETILAEDLAFTQRRLAFSGNLLHATLNTEVSAEEVTVFANGAELCSDDIGYDTSTSFTCIFTGDLTETLAITYSVQGAWGTVEVAGPTITEFPPVGGTLAITEDLYLSPTTLIITGTVSLPDATPVANAYVTAKSPLFANYAPYNEGDGPSPWVRLSDRSDAQGAYQMVAFVPADAATVPFTFDLSTSAIDIDDVFTTSAAVTPNGVVTATVPLTVSGRSIRFYGDVTNSLVPAMGIDVQAITITNELGEVICQDDGGYSGYYCDTVVGDLNAFTAQMTLAGAWGSQTFPIAVPAGAPNTVTVLENDLAVAVTTVHLTGTARDLFGLINYGYLEATGPSVIDEPSAYVYNGVINLYIGVTAEAGTIRLRLTNGQDVPMFFDLPYAAQSGAVTEMPIQLNHDRRGLFISGRLINAYTGQNLQSRAITITVPGDPSASCQDGTPGGMDDVTYFDCKLGIFGTDAVDAQVTVSGDWGTSVFTYTLPAGSYGSPSYIYPQIQVTPTRALTVSGVVRGPNGQPVTSGMAIIRTTGVVSNDQSRFLSLDAQGRFTTTLVALESASEVGFEVQAFANGSVTVTRTVTLTNDPLQPVEFVIDLP